MNPVQKYRVVYADPPWRFNDKQSSRPGTYPRMTHRELRTLDVGSIAAANSALFMWAVSALLPEALNVMRAWGFDYRAIAFVWCKRTKSGDGDAFGMGSYTRQSAEVCLLGVRGAPEIRSRSVRQVISSPRLRHSQKPPEVRDRIVGLMGDVPRIELFARESAPGWATWGNEAPEPVELAL